MTNTTPRLSLQEPVGADSPSALRLSVTNHATTLDSSALFLSGTISNRPAASLAGRYYLATDVHDGGPQGTIYQDNGSTWVYPNQTAYAQGAAGSRPTAGTQGRHYLTTDTNQLSHDNGTSWIPHGLSLRSVGVNITANPGDWVDAQSGVTVTLPTGYVGALIAITSFSGTTGANPVTVNGGTIYGLGFAASTFKLGGGVSPVILAGQGGGVWNMIAGKQDSGWRNIALNGAVWTTVFSPAPYTPAARVQGDRVWLRGAVSSGTIGTSTIGTLPAGCAPAFQAYMPAGSQTGGNGMTTIINVTTGGLLQATISIVSGSISNILGLDGLSYSLI